MLLRQISPNAASATNQYNPKQALSRNSTEEQHLTLFSETLPEQHSSSFRKYVRHSTF